VFSIVKRIEFCAGHRLINYKGKCAHAHGHNYVAEVELQSAETDSTGFVADFGLVKDLVKSWIDENLDHAFLCAADDRVMLEFLIAQGQKHYVTILNPTAEHIAEMIFGVAQSEGLPVVAVRVWETPTGMAEYRPTFADTKEEIAADSAQRLNVQPTQGQVDEAMRRWQASEHGQNW